MRFYLHHLGWWIFLFHYNNFLSIYIFCFLILLISVFGVIVHMHFVNHYSIIFTQHVKISSKLWNTAPFDFFFTGKRRYYRDGNSIAQSQAYVMIYHQNQNSSSFATTDIVFLISYVDHSIKLPAQKKHYPNTFIYSLALFSIIWKFMLVNASLYLEHFLLFSYRHSSKV